MILLPVLVALATLGLSCRSSASLHAIDPIVASCIPPTAVILAGVNLERLRASPLYRQFPPAVTAFLEPIREASSLLVASDGRDYLAISRGSFRQPPPGATLLAPGLAAAGSPDWVRAAATQQRFAAPARLALLEPAEALAGSSEIWMAMAGGANLPVSGNAENLSRLLRATEYTTLSVKLANTITLEAIGTCATPEIARKLEETVRAFITLGAAAGGRQTAIGGLLKRIRISREDRAVHLNLSAEPAEMEQLFKIF